MPRKATNTEQYEYVRAVVDEGELSWTHKLKGHGPVGRLRHDEDVIGWSEKEIVDLTCATLDCGRAIVRVEWR